MSHNILARATDSAARGKTDLRQIVPPKPEGDYTRVTGGGFHLPVSASDLGA